VKSVKAVAGYGEVYEVELSCGHILFKRLPELRAEGLRAGRRKRCDECWREARGIVA
jgi:hypothetical protein